MTHSIRVLIVPYVCNLLGFALVLGGPLSGSVVINKLVPPVTPQKSSYLMLANFSSVPSLNAAQS